MLPNISCTLHKKTTYIYNNSTVNVNLTLAVNENSVYNSYIKNGCCKAATIYIMW